MKIVKNVPASVRQRLLDRARTNRRPFNELLQYYAIERFLYRFSLSVHLNRFVLKGALMLSDSFIDSKQGQWTAFWKRLNQEHVPKKLRDIVIGIKEFLSPAISYFSSEKSNPGKWKAPGPWN